MPEREIIPTEKALAMITDGDYIHTFRTPFAGTMVGCDISRESLLEKMNEFSVELSGEIATGMNHGLVLIDGVGPLFIETLKEKDND